MHAKYKVFHLYFREGFCAKVIKVMQAKVKVDFLFCSLSPGSGGPRIHAGRLDQRNGE